MNRCEKNIDLISAYLDNRISKLELIEFEKHINECENCRKTLEEYKLQIELCKDLEDEDLPLGFKEELHSKLLLEKKKSKSLGLITLSRNKYIRTFASIAAGLVFLVMLKGIFGNMDFYLSRTNLAYDAPKTEAPAAQAAPAAAEAANSTAAMDETQKYDAPVAETTVRETPKTGAGLADNSKGISKSVAKKETSDSAADKQTENIEVKAKTQLAPELKSFSTSNSFEGNNDNSSVFITVDNTKEGIDKIKTFLSIVGGSTVEDILGSSDLRMQTTADMDGQSTEILLRVKVPKSQLEKFNNSLKELDSSIIYEKSTEENIDAKLLEIQKSYDEINQQIESGEVKDQEVLDKLILDRDKLKESLDFTFITISIKKK